MRTATLRLRSRPAFGLVISLWHAKAKDVSCFPSSRSDKGGDYHAGTFTAHRDNNPCHPNIGARTNGETGSFITASSFKGIEQAQQTGGHMLSHGVVYGIVTEVRSVETRSRCRQMCLD
jgi:hypothetical protein